MNDAKDKQPKPAASEMPQTISPARRRLLAALATGGVVGANALPERWIKPVVDSVLLPAHAQATGIAPSAGAVSLVIGARESTDESLLARALEFVVPSAHARPPDSLYICVTPNAAGTKAGVKVWEIYGSCATLHHEANNVPVTNTWVPMTPTACAFKLTGLLDKLGIVKDAYAPNGAEVRLKSVTNGAKGEFRLYSGGPVVTFDLPLGGCNEPECCDV